MRDLSEYDQLWDGSNADWILVETGASVETSATGSPSDPQLLNRATGEPYPFVDDAERHAVIAYLQVHGVRAEAQDEPIPPVVPDLPVVPVIDDQPLPIAKIVIAAAVLIVLIAVLALLRVGPFTEEPWNIQFGSDKDDRIDVSAVAPSGDVVVAGITNGSLFGHYHDGDDVWIARYDSSGTMEWGRHLGSPDDEAITAITVDAEENTIIVGGTEGSLFAVNGGAEDDGHPHHDIFILKLNPFGKIVWSKQVAVKGDEMPAAVAVTGSGAILIAGDTDHQIFPRGNGGHTVEGSSDIFLTKFDPNGRNLWGIQYGGTIPTFADTVALDTVGNCYVAGRSAEPVAGREPVPTSFIAKFDNTGKLKWSAQVPTGDSTFPAAATTDTLDNVYVSSSMLFGREDQHPNPGIIELDSTGKLLRRVEFAPPPGFVVSSAIPDKRGGIILTGATTSSMYAEIRGKDDAAINRYAPDGRLIWGNQIGSTGSELLTGAALGPRGVIYAYGKTDGGLFRDNLGGDDAILMKIDRGGHVNDRGYWGEVSAKPPKKKDTSPKPVNPADL